MIKKIVKYIKKPSLLYLFLNEKGFFKNVSDEKHLRRLYKIRVGKKLNISNPQTFNEKLQWLKLYDRKDIYTTMVDKYEVKKYVSDIIGEQYIIPTLGIYERFDDIIFDDLPNQFVIKCTHDSGGVFVVKDKNNIDLKKIKKFINKHLKKNYYYPCREWPYKNVVPRILVEKYMKSDLNDYKFFCFNGKPKYCLVCSERNIKLKETFFDLNWNIVPFKRKDYSVDNKIIRPEKLDLMIELAKKLSCNVPFLRVDFYEIDGVVYFGELTFYPANGLSRFDPDEWDYKLGQLIELSDEVEKK